MHLFLINVSYVSYLFSHYRYHAIRHLHEQGKHKDPIQAVFLHKPKIHCPDCLYDDAVKWSDVCLFDIDQADIPGRIPSNIFYDLLVIQNVLLHNAQCKWTNFLHFLAVHHLMHLPAFQKHRVSDHIHNMQYYPFFFAQNLVSIVHKQVLAHRPPNNPDKRWLRWLALIFHCKSW